MKLNWNFLGGGGVQKKKHLPWGEYGYFLELHNASSSFVLCSLNGVKKLKNLARSFFFFFFVGGIFWFHKHILFKFSTNISSILKQPILSHHFSISNVFFFLQTHKHKKHRVTVLK